MATEGGLNLRRKKKKKKKEKEKQQQAHGNLTTGWMGTNHHPSLFLQLGHIDVLNLKWYVKVLSDA